jgi:hypothetical protein
MRGGSQTILFQLVFRVSYLSADHFLFLLLVGREYVVQIQVSSRTDNKQALLAGVIRNVGLLDTEGV